MIGDKEIINHRSISLVINECCAAILKSLANNIQEQIHNKFDQSELAW